MDNGIPLFPLFFMDNSNPSRVNGRVNVHFLCCIWPGWLTGHSLADKLHLLIFLSLIFARPLGFLRALYLMYSFNNYFSTINTQNIAQTIKCGRLRQSLSTEWRDRGPTKTGEPPRNCNRICLDGTMCVPRSSSRRSQDSVALGPYVF